MIFYKEGNRRFNYRVVGVCIHNDQILLQRAVTDDFWALPGGRAELLEYSPETLRREMKEELDMEVGVGRLLWISENFFELEGNSWHELSLYYTFNLPEGHIYYTSAEFHGIEEDSRLMFKWHPKRIIDQSTKHPCTYNAPEQGLNNEEGGVSIVARTGRY